MPAADPAPAFQRVVDVRLVATIATLVGTATRGAAPAPVWAPRELMWAAAAAVAEHGLPGGPGRHRSVRQQLACYAAVYGRYHLPGEQWQLTALGLECGALVWTDPTGRVVADLPRAAHTDTPLVTDAATDVLARYSHVEHLIGARLLPLAAPLAGRLLTPDGALTALPDLTAPTLVPALAG